MPLTDPRRKGSLDYMPFSFGKRKCPGETYALLVTKYLLVRICQTFHTILPGENGPYQATTRVGTTIRNGLWLRVRRTRPDNDINVADGGGNNVGGDCTATELTLLEAQCERDRVFSEDEGDTGNNINVAP